MSFTRPKKAIGLDIGVHAVKAVQMSRSSGRLLVEQARQILVDRNMVNNDPVTAQAVAVRECLRTMAPAQSLIVAALAGQTVVVRYPRMANVGQEQLAQAVNREAAHNIPYDLNDVFLDWTILEESTENEQKQLKVLLVAAKHEAIDSRMQVMQNAEIQCGILGVDSLALADAAEACDFLRVGETVAIVNIGLGSASVHFIKDGISNFIREVNWGSREMIQAIAKDRRCSYEEAVSQLENFIQIPVDSQAVPEAEEADLPVADELPEASPVVGGASLLDPLDDEIMHTPAAQKKDLGGYSNPFVQQQAPTRPLSEVLAAPLARMAMEFRRSFDFYEHQLYEQPVNRIILCGGVARMQLISETLHEELGIDDIEVASPENSALFLGAEDDVDDLLQQGSQYMVAIGLAARGMADL